MTKVHNTNESRRYYSYSYSVLIYNWNTGTSVCLLYAIPFLIFRYFVSILSCLHLYQYYHPFISSLNPYLFSFLLSLTFTYLFLLLSQILSFPFFLIFVFLSSSSFVFSLLSSFHPSSYNILQFLYSFIVCTIHYRYMHPTVSRVVPMFVYRSIYAIQSSRSYYILDGSAFGA